MSLVHYVCRSTVHLNRALTFGAENLLVTQCSKLSPCVRTL